MDDLSRFCCQNPDCPDYGRRGRDNLRVGFRYGKHRRLMLVCRTCQDRFSERKGTALFATRLPDDQAVAVLQHLQDGCGVRQTGRLVGVDKDTVVRYAAAGRRPRPPDSTTNSWLFPPTTRKSSSMRSGRSSPRSRSTASPARDRCGDCWDHVAFDPDSRLVLSVVVGKRTEANATQVVHEVWRGPMAGRST